MVLFTTLALVVAFTGACATVSEKLQDVTQKIVPAITAVLPHDVPLPSTITVSPPSTQVNEKLARFSGVWVGEWNTFGIRGMTRINHVLAVENVYPTGAIILYAWGENPVVPEAIMWRPGWVRRPAGFSDGSMIVDLPNGATVTYTLNSDGTITGVWVKGWVAHTTLRKVASASEYPGDVGPQPATRHPQVVQAAERTDPAGDKLKPLKWLIGVWEGETQAETFQTTQLRVEFKGDGGAIQFETFLTSPYSRVHGSKARGSINVSGDTITMQGEYFEGGLIGVVSYSLVRKDDNTIEGRGVGATMVPFSVRLKKTR